MTSTRQIDTDAVPRQAAAFPFRRTGGVVEVCLIRKKGSSKWGIPKGVIDPGNTPETTALQEAHEEAGLRGRLLGPSVGSYRIAKWGLSLLVVMFVMEVLEEDADWEEAGIRERKWMPFTSAASLLSNRPVGGLLQRAAASIPGWSA